VSLSDAGTAALAQRTFGPWHPDNQPATVHQENYKLQQNLGPYVVTRCRDTIRKLPGVSLVAFSLANVFDRHPPCKIIVRPCDPGASAGSSELILILNLITPKAGG